MPAITAAGIGSGLDIASLVTQLVNAEGTPQSNRLDAAQATVNAQISAVGTLRGALSNLSSALAQLKSSGAFAKRTATSSDAKAFTATAGSAAAPGTYAIQVDSVASAHRLASVAYPGAASNVGTGQLTIANGSASFNLTIDTEHASLAGIRDAINAASGNTFVNASIVNAADGAHLVLSARATGEANALRVTQSGGDGGLAALVHDPGVHELDEKSAAADAAISVDGFSYTHADNSIDGVIEGVTIDVLKASLTDTYTLTVARDDEAVRKAVSSFVTAYNIVKASISTTTRYDSGTRTASALTGDALPRSIDSQLRGVLGAIRSSGTYTALGQVGVSFAADGALKLDQTKLDAALAANAPAVNELFTSSTNGFATNLSTIVEGLTATGGLLATRTTGLNDKLRDISDRRVALERRLSEIETRYRTQFTALDTLVAQMNSTSSFLSSQLASLS